MRMDDRLVFSGDGYETGRGALVRIRRRAALKPPDGWDQKGYVWPIRITLRIGASPSGSGPCAALPVLLREPLELTAEGARPAGASRQK
jgi:hypothetical protein